MHQIKDKKYNVIFYVFLLLLLSSINNYYFFKTKNSFLKIKDIQVEGLELSLNLEVKRRLSFLIGKNIFNIDNKKLEIKLNSLNYLENYKVSKLFPSILKVNLEKTKFVAKTYQDGKKYFIGLNKKKIYLPSQIENSNLPVVYGKFTNEEFFNLRKILLDNNFGIENISNYYYFSNKRWDIELNDGTLVKLPMENTNNAINKLTKLIRKKIKKKIK